MYVPILCRDLKKLERLQFPKIKVEMCADVGKCLQTFGAKVSEIVLVDNTGNG